MKFFIFFFRENQYFFRESMVTKQEICINIALPQEIIKVIQQCLSFCADFESIFDNKNNEFDEFKQKFLERKYNENLFKLDLILEISKVASSILQSLCRENQAFQKYLL